MDEHKKSHRAEQFFKREISDSDIQKGAHFTFRDGFRLGFGFFIGFMLGLVIISLITAVVNSIFKLF
jgi:hypothetical protein